MLALYTVRQENREVGGRRPLCLLDLVECAICLLLLQGRIFQFPHYPPQPQNWKISTFPRQSTHGLFL